MKLQCPRIKYNNYWHHFYPTGNYVTGTEYKGKSLGTLNSYHHQVGGQVYAVNEYTLLISDFTFDGSANDAFFWAGASSRPGPQGFILANEYGR